MVATVGACGVLAFGAIGQALASAGRSATANGLAFTYISNFQQIVVAQPFAAGERIQIVYNTYTNGGGVGVKTVNVGQGNGSGNANAGGFGRFTLSAPGSFGPFTVPGGGITQLSMSIAGGQGVMSSTGTITCLLAPTATGLTSSANPSTIGQGVTFTVTVTGTSPSGTVQFNDGTRLSAPRSR